MFKWVSKGVSSVGETCSNFIDVLFEKLDKLPTTNTRIAVTLLLVILTGIATLFMSYVPTWEWLIFLAGMSGLDVWQHHNKRKTTWTPEQIARAQRIKNGSEIEDGGFGQ